MSDLVARLRKNSYDLLHAGAIDPGLPGDGELMIEAADRIEELEKKDWARLDHDSYCEGRIRELEHALEALVDLKEMKDNYGKPKNYEELKVQLWGRARTVLPRELTP